MNVRELREKRAALWSQAQEYAARNQAGEKLTDTDARDWQRCLDECDNLARQLRSMGVDLSSSTNGTTIDVRGGSHDGPEARSFTSWLRSGDDNHLRAAGTSVGSSGGYLVPTGFRNIVTETMKAFGGLRRFAEVISTDNGADLPWPTNDDTSNVGAILGENTQASEQDFTFGEKELGGYMYTSKIVRVALQLIQDSGFNVDTWLPRRLGIRIGRAQAPHYLTGTGASQPQGLLTAGTVGKTAASATTVTYDELVDLQTSVDAANLEEPDGVGWLMNQTSWGVIRKLKDSQNRPLVEPNLQDGRPNMLLGYPVQIDNGMPSMATTNKSIAFGNFRAGYVIRDVGAPEVIRMVERYADYLQVGFIGYQRSDGMVQDVSAFKLLQQA
jgi:HK97 family phage major capsid protein